MKEYKVTKVVKEVYHTPANNREEAIKIISERGNPSAITVMSIKCTPKR